MSTRSLLHWLALVAGAELLVRGHLLDRSDWLHVGAWLLAAGLTFAARGPLAGHRVLAAGTSLLALASALLSVATALAPGARDEVPDPLLSLWESHAADRRLLDAGRAEPTDQVELFGTAIALGPGGTRARASVGARGRRYRIVAAGGSSTFGATRGAAERPWPALLEAAIRGELDCALPVEVVNAGVIGRGIAGVVKGFEAEIVPLDPQLLIYESGVHELDELAQEHPELRAAAFEPTPARASPLLRSLEQRWRRSADASRWREARQVVPDRAKPAATRLAGAYRHLLLDARRHGIEVVLAGLALALPEDAPADAVRRYEALDPRTRQRLLALDLHRRVLRQLAATYRATLLDPTPGPGEAREALFLDLQLRSQLGRERLAGQLLATLRPRLARATPGCRPRGAGSL
jgi:hypothetical protein